MGKIVSFQIMKDFNLELQPGKSHALVGPSGCGKSTAVSILERFYDVIEGEVSCTQEFLSLDDLVTVFTMSIYQYIVSVSIQLS